MINAISKIPEQEQPIAEHVVAHNLQQRWTNQRLPSQRLIGSVPDPSLPNPPNTTNCVDTSHIGGGVLSSSNDHQGSTLLNDPQMDAQQGQIPQLSTQQGVSSNPNANGSGKGERGVLSSLAKTTTSMKKLLVKAHRFIFSDSNTPNSLTASTSNQSEHYAQRDPSFHTRAETYDDPDANQLSQILSGNSNTDNYFYDESMGGNNQSAPQNKSTALIETTNLTPRSIAKQQQRSTTWSHPTRSLTAPTQMPESIATHQPARHRQLARQPQSAWQHCSITTLQFELSPQNQPSVAAPHQQQFVTTHGCQQQYERSSQAYHGQEVPIMGQTRSARAPLLVETQNAPASLLEAVLAAQHPRGRKGSPISLILIPEEGQYDLQCLLDNVPTAHCMGGNNSSYTPSMDGNNHSLYETIMGGNNHNHSLYETILGGNNRKSKAGTPLPCCHSSPKIHTDFWIGN